MVEETKTDWKMPVIVVVAVVVVAIIVFMVMRGSFSKNVIQEDVQISDFHYGYDENNIGLSYEEGKGIKTSFIATITTNRDNLYLKVYDAKNDLEINYDYESPSTLDEYNARKLNVGDNEFVGINNLYLSSLSQQPKLKFCISTKVKFNQNSKGVVCKIETFDNPEFRYEITPSDPLIFTFSKQDTDLSGVFAEKIIKIKNVGEMVAPFEIFLPNYQSMENYGDYNPQYFGGAEVFRMHPGDVQEITIQANLLPTWDAPVGAYETQGFIYGLPGEPNSEKGSIFKKEFTLKTIVTP